MDGVQLLQGWTEPLQGDRLLLNSWYLLDQCWKDERLRLPCKYPVVLNLFINIVNTKYKLKSQFELIQL